MATQLTDSDSSEMDERLPCFSHIEFDVTGSLNAPHSAKKQNEVLTASDSNQDTNSTNESADEDNLS